MKSKISRSRRVSLGLIIILIVVVLIVVGAIGYYFYKEKDKVEVGLQEINLHLYNNEQVSVNKVLIRLYYYVPQDKENIIIDDWQKIFANSMLKIKEFFQLQFAYNMGLDYEIYPEIIYSDHDLNYFIDLLKEDYEKELAGPYTGSVLVEEIINNIRNKIAMDNEWDLLIKEIDDYYIINLFVLASDVTTLEGYNRQVPGLNDEENNSVVMSYIFTNDEFKDFHESIICHEVGHDLGIAEFYSFYDNKISSYGVMGGGVTRILQNNYLDNQIKEKMGLYEEN